MENELYISAAAIAAALALDLVFGDPPWMPHPVRFIGRAVTLGEARLRVGEPRADFWRGALLASAVVILTAFAAWIAVAIASDVANWLGLAAAMLIAWTTLALSGLDRAAGEVEQALDRGRDDLARAAMPALVGRDPATLDRDAMVRATVESVAENCSDGVLAPLCFLFVGGPVLALAYKAINTLDSMIGYRDARHLHFGRAAARLDDAANFVPARLTALCLAAAAALTLGRGGAALGACRADARKHASPNAGFPEATMAGALGIELGGDAVYAGEVEHRARLGRAERAARVADIATARRLMRIATAIGFCLLALVRYVLCGY
ncbi:MAG TPA: adenosylcobinamide-phosphate synthase CbiB [Candidatus Binataceae bacterium]|nr:adenosylcobinamide-phosphate synthase CbiB [Candidatus Binataceae bacterium]